MVCCIGLLSNLSLILFFESWIFQPSKSICEYHLIFRDFLVFIFKVQPKKIWNVHKPNCFRSQAEEMTEVGYDALVHILVTHLCTWSP